MRPFPSREGLGYGGQTGAFQLHPSLGGAVDTPTFASLPSMVGVEGCAGGASRFSGRRVQRALRTERWNAG